MSNIYNFIWGLETIYHKKLISEVKNIIIFKNNI